MEVDLFIMLHTQIKHKWITDLNGGAKAIRHVKENNEGNLDDLRLGKAPFDMTPKAGDNRKKTK